MSTTIIFTLLAHFMKQCECAIQFLADAKNCRQRQVTYLILLTCVLTAVGSAAPLVVMGLSVNSAAPVRTEEHATTSQEIVPALLGGR